MSELLDIAVEEPCTQLTETCTCIQYTDTHSCMQAYMFRATLTSLLIHRNYILLAASTKIN